MNGSRDSVDAFHRHLLASDEEWVNCMKKLKTFEMPPQMLQTLALLCLFCKPTNPLDLWNEFRKDLIVDFELSRDEASAINMALRHLKSSYSMASHVQAFNYQCLQKRCNHLPNMMDN